MKRCVATRSGSRGVAADAAGHSRQAPAGRSARAVRHRHGRALPALVGLTLLLAGCASSVGDAGPLQSPGATRASMAPTAASSMSPEPATAAPPAASPAAPSRSPSGVPTPTPAAARVTGFSIYLLQGETLVPVYRQAPHTLAVARAALDALLAGPTPAEAAGPARLLTLVPEGTALLGVSIASGIATVDLTGEFESGGGSASMFGRLAQVVYTLTQFPSVDGVLFRLDGQPVTVFSGEGIGLEGPSVREDYRDYLPLIMVERPAWGSSLPNPARLAGIANVFEAQFVAEITTSGGTLLARENVHASCGTGCWGSFDVTVPYSVDRPQPGLVTVYDLSPRDGSRENVRAYPVTLAPAR